jgi:hypothetical protein
MANKLLILGAAMAHKNKSYNLGIGIGPTVDKSVAKFQKILSDRQAKLNASSKYAQGKIDRLDADPELDLLPEGIKDLFVTDLNNTRKTLGELYTEKDLNAYKYSPGTEAYTEITKLISQNEKKLKKRQKQANDFLQKRANWITEHGDISETFKLRFPDQYNAMINIFDPTDPNYNATFDENDDLVFNTGIIDDSNPDPNYARAGKNRKNVSLKLDDLDWGMFPQPEIMKINEFYEVAANAGAQKREIPGGTLQNMRVYLDNVIKKNENAVYSLLFDDLPIGDPNNKMPLFTDEDFAEMFPNFNESDESTWPDFEQLKDAAVNKLISNIQLENTSAIEKQNPTELNYYNTGTQTQMDKKFSTGALIQQTIQDIAALKDKSVKSIANYIQNSSPFSGKISLIEDSGDVQAQGVSSEAQMLQKYNILSQLKQAAGGNIYPLIQKLFNETGLGFDTIMGIDQYKILERKGQVKFLSSGL